MLSELWKYAQYFGWTPFVVIFQSENKMVGFVGLQYNKKHFMKFSFKEIIKIYGLETIRATLYFLTNLFENTQPNQLHSEIIAVDEKQRTKGIGTKILLSTIEYAKQKVFHQIRI